MLNEVKHLGCVHVDVHEIFRFAQDDIALRYFSQINFVLLSINFYSDTSFKRRVYEFGFKCRHNL